MPYPFNPDTTLLADIFERAGRAVSDALLYGGYYRQRIGLTAASSNTDCPPFARYGLPYCLQALDSSRAILLNRDYKPVGIGIPYSMHVDYEAFPQWHLTGEALASALAADCWATMPAPELAYLYDDGCPPWGGAKDLRTYASRLALLADAIATREPVCA